MVPHANGVLLWRPGSVSVATGGICSLQDGLGHLTGENSKHKQVDEFVLMYIVGTTAL